MVALFWKVQQPGRREGGRACVKERGPDEREPGGSRRRKETRSGTRGEQLCIKLKQATSEAFPWHYARRPMRFARADTRVSHDCRCCVHGTTCLPIKPHQRYHEPGTSWMHLEKPLAFLQPERERENATRGSWEIWTENFFHGNNASKYRLSPALFFPSWVACLQLALYHFSTESSLLMLLASSSRFRLPRIPPFSRADHVHHAHRPRATANMAD